MIRDLRAQSGTGISISDPELSTPDERVVTLSGSPQGISHAVFLIRQLVEAYNPNNPNTRNNGQQQQQQGQQQQQPPDPDGRCPPLPPMRRLVRSASKLHMTPELIQFGAAADGHGQTIFESP